MSDDDYDDYEEAIAFEGDFQGEPLITRALIYSDRNIQIHQGPKTGEKDSGDTEFRPDDIVGIDQDELEDILEKARNVRAETVDKKDNEELWIQTWAYEHTVHTPENGRETVLSYNEDDTQLDEDLEIIGTTELVTKKDFHLWLADLKKEIDFDSHEEAEGARKLVEQAAFNLGTHGRQILQEKLEEGDTQSK